MKDASTKNACLYVTGTSKDRKTGAIVEFFCKKIQAEDSVYCPRHLLMVQDYAPEYKRRAVKAQATRERKKALAEALEKSPLLAENPKFPQNSSTGYER